MFNVNVQCQCSVRMFKDRCERSMRMPDVQASCRLFLEREVRDIRQALLLVRIRRDARQGKGACTTRPPRRYALLRHPDIHQGIGTPYAMAPLWHPSLDYDWSGYTKISNWVPRNDSTYCSLTPLPPPLYYCVRTLCMHVMLRPPLPPKPELATGTREAGTGYDAVHGHQTRAGRGCSFD